MTAALSRIRGAAALPRVAVHSQKMAGKNRDLVQRTLRARSVLVGPLTVPNGKTMLARLSRDLKETEDLKKREPHLRSSMEISIEARKIDISPFGTMVKTRLFGIIDSLP